MRTIHVAASTGYDVLIGSGISRDSGQLIAGISGSRSAVIVSDDNVFPLYGAALRENLEHHGLMVSEFVFPHGEKSKNLETYGQLLEFLCEKHITRSDVLVALGGGVVGDLTGFAAATYQRGVKFVQIPTTLLAAVDSSVGGKTAVDLAGGKNMVGSFYQPSLVICDTDLQKTLPEDEYKCGCAEVIKYAVIGDEKFFGELCAVPVSDQLEHVISVCVSMKRGIVEHDEFDRGERMLLNFGHTFGHAAELCSGYSMLHGQAVAAGMAVMARSAAANGLCGEEVPEAIISILKKYGLPTEIAFSLDDMFSAALSDKKLSGASISIVTPERIGKCRIEKIAAGELRARMLAGGIK